MADVSVRPAIGADAGRIAELQLQVWRSAYSDLLPSTALDELTLEAAREQWLAAATAPPTRRHLVLTALDGHRVVGFAAIAPPEDTDVDAATTGELLVLIVDPDAAGTGHGSRLLAAAVQHLREQGQTTAVAWVLDGDAVTRRFLEGAGWALDGAGRQLDMGQAVSQVRLHTDLTESD